MKRKKRRTTKKKNTKYNQLFLKYSSNHNHLTKKEITKLMKKEFKLSYSNHVIHSLMVILGEKKRITKITFTKLFKKPYGFFRDITL